VGLLGDLRGVLHVYATDGEALDAHAEDRLRRGLRFRRGLRDLHAAGLAAPADLHLRLHDDGKSERGRGGLRFGGCRRDATFGDRDTGPREHLFGLEFVELHGSRTLSFPFMRRVVVGGSTASGKSTIARALGARINVPVIELHATRHGPNWTETPEDRFRALVGARTSEDAWVVDGNYQMVRDLTWGRAD